jgi:integrase
MLGCVTAPKQRGQRARRAEPISKRVARNGTVSYEFRVDVGTKPDGSRDRRRFTCRTLAEARREYRRITSEVAEGRYAKRSPITVDAACDEWLAGRRNVRAVTRYSYEMDLKPVRRFLGGRKLQALTKADGDRLVEWMLTEARTSPRHYRPGSLSGRVAALVAQRPEGISTAQLRAELPGEDIHQACSALLSAGRIVRLARGVYGPAGGQARAEQRGLSPQTIRSALTTFSTVVQNYVDQGVLARNPVSLVERPKDADLVPAVKSWTLAEVERFRESVRSHRLFACWLLSMYGLRRSEVLGLCWDAVDLDSGTLSVRRGRVAVGSQALEGAPKSRRSRRDLPLPADVIAALRALKTTQKQESLTLGIGWSDDRLIAVHEDSTPVRPEWYSDEFQRFRELTGLRRIRLHGLRNTSVSLMLDQHHPVHIVASWHGHTPSMALAVYSEAKAAELRTAGESLFSQQP